MKLQNKGFLVYILCFVALLLLLLFFVYKKNKSSIVINDLLKVGSKYSFVREDPCFTGINGLPRMGEDMQTVQVNVNCPNGKVSTNYLYYAAVANMSTTEILELISQVNSYKIKFDENNGNIVAMGSIQNTSTKNWRVQVNGDKDITLNRKYNPIPGEVITVTYE